MASLRGLNIAEFHLVDFVLPSRIQRLQLIVVASLGTREVVFVEFPPIVVCFHAHEFHDGAGVTDTQLGRAFRDALSRGIPP